MINRSIFIVFFSLLIFCACGRTEQHKMSIKGYEVFYKLYIDGNNKRAIRLSYSSDIPLYINKKLVKENEEKVKNEILEMFEEVKDMINELDRDVAYFSSQFHFEKLSFFAERYKSYHLVFKKNDANWIYEVK